MDCDGDEIASEHQSAEDGVEHTKRATKLQANPSLLDPHCPQHPHRTFQAFCEEDHSLLCLDCILDNHAHKEHRVVSLDQAGKRVRERVAGCLDVIDKDVDVRVNAA